jgi:hypothetical protein
MLDSIYSGGGYCFSRNLIGCSTPDILAIFTSNLVPRAIVGSGYEIVFTSGQKQNGFRSRYTWAIILQNNSAVSPNTKKATTVCLTVCGGILINNITDSVWIGWRVTIYTISSIEWKIVIGVRVRTYNHLVNWMWPVVFQLKTSFMIKLWKKLVNSYSYIGFYWLPPLTTWRFSDCMKAFSAKTSHAAG